MTARNYLFTINNYSDTEIEEIKKFFETHCKYGIYGKEKGDKGTPHL